MALRKLLLILSLFIMGDCFGQSPMFKLIAKRQSSCSYLLDQYSGAAAAYSLRKLDCDYAGSAIRVRRSSDNTEQDIGFLNGYLDTTTLKTFISTSDAFVVTWYDQSGNSRNMTNATSSGQPKIATSGALLYTDGWVCLEFDATNDHLTNNYQNLTNISSFLVAAKVSNDDFGLWQNTYFSIGQTSVNNWGYFNRFRLSGVVTSGFFGTGTLAATSVGEMALMFGTWASSSVVTHWRNGTSNTNSSTTGATLRNGSGGEVYYGGKAYECLIWSSDKTSDRDGVASNINTFYSIY